MSNLNQFIGGGAITVIGRAANVVSLPNQTSSLLSGSMIGALSGVCVAGVLKTALNLTGAGTLDIFSIQSLDPTSRTLRVVITIDNQSVPVYDKTSPVISTANAGIVPVGITNYIIASGVCALMAEPMVFKSSCLVQFASSLSETDAVLINYQYRKTT